MLAAPALSTLLAAVLFSYLICALIVLTQRWHGRMSLDGDMSSVQKFHKIPVPRVGGIGLLAGLVAASVIIVSSPHAPDVLPDSVMLTLLIVAALPAFFAGLAEDVTKRVSVRTRLIATAGSALLAGWLVGATLTRVDVPGIDPLFALLPVLALLFTLVAATGVANAINIIDGFHGLAGVAVVIMLLGLGWLAHGAGDQLVLQLALIGAAAMLGFLLVNYPTGRVFLGDGGAYLAGFWLAEVAILLISRNASVPAWQALAVCAFPVIEVLFSMYRKRVLRNISPTMPDKLHMHMLIYRRLVWRLLPRDDRRPWKRNAMVACVIGTWIGVSTLLAVTMGGATWSALLVIALNVVFYLAAYTRLVRGRWPLERGRVARGMRGSRHGVQRALPQARSDA